MSANECSWFCVFLSDCLCGCGWDLSETLWNEWKHHWYQRGNGDVVRIFGWFTVVSLATMESFWCSSNTGNGLFGSSAFDGLCICISNYIMYVKQILRIRKIRTHHMQLRTPSFFNVSEIQKCSSSGWQRIKFSPEQSTKRFY